MDTTTVLIQGVIAAVIIVVTVYGRPLVKQLTETVKWGVAEKIVAKFVYAAEEYVKGQKKGPEKLDYATEKIKAALKVLGITLDDDLLKAMIEGTVFENLNKEKERISA